VVLGKKGIRRYGDRLDVKQELSGPGGGPIQVQALVDVLLCPANLERLDDVEVAAIRSAAAKLALPAPVIDGVAQTIAEAMASSRAPPDDVDASELDGDPDE
jgi:hypothetical protein